MTLHKIGSALALTLALNLGTAASASAAPTNKQLTIGIQQEFDTLNPIISSMVASRYISAMVQHPLLSIDADWKYQPFLIKDVPSLENGLAKIIDEKGQKKMLVSWEIKPEASWGDGKPVTGEDVKVSWQIGLDPAVTVGERDIYERIEAIDIDPKNPKKFTMKLKEARYDFYAFPSLGIVPAHLEGPIHKKTKGQTGAYEKQSTYVTSPTNPGLWNGPYLVKEVRIGSHVILEKNPKFTPAAKIERIIVKLIPSTQTLEANLLSGTIDMISELGLTFDQALAFDKRLKTDANLRSKFKVEFVDGMTYEHIDLNLGNPALQDINVRKALAYSMDLEKLTKALFDGRQKLALHNIHPKDVYYSEDVVKYPFDPKKAEELLEQAGWKKAAGGIREKDGKKLSFTLMTTAQNKLRELVQVFLQEQWRKIGIEVNIQNEPARTFFAETMQKRKYGGMGMYAWSSSPDNPPRSTLYSDSIPTEKNGWSGQNYPGYANKRVDELLDQVRTEFDLNKRKQLMAELLKLYTDEVPVLSLYNRAEIAVVPSHLQGMRITGHQFSGTQNVEQWDLGGGTQGH